MAAKYANPSGSAPPGMNLLMLTSLVNRFFGLHGLLADVVGDIRQVAFVGTDGIEIVQLTDDVQSTQGFPDLIRAGIDDRNLLTRGYVGASLRNGANASWNCRTNLDGLRRSAWCQLCD